MKNRAALNRAACAIEVLHDALDRVSEAGRLYDFQHTISLGDASLRNKKFL
jgi:hypothetical protein